MATIGLIAAMSQESRALLRLANGSKRIAIGKQPAYTFSIFSLSCVLVTSGMGVQRAGQAARTLAENYAPDRLISFGIAGAVEPDLDIGDVVLGEAYCRFEDQIIGERRSLMPWSESACEAARQALARLGRQLYIGTAVTTRGSTVMPGQLGDIKHPVLEMETAGIAQAAAEKGIPLLSLRAISDGPRSPIPLDLGEVMDEDANLRVGKMVAAVLRNPKIVLQSTRMMRNTQVAADNAALALMAALSKFSD